MCCPGCTCRPKEWGLTIVQAKLAGDLISYLPVVDGRGRTNARQIRHAGQKTEMRRAPSRIPRAAVGLCTLALGAAAALGYPCPVEAAPLGPRQQYPK